MDAIAALNKLMPPELHFKRSDAPLTKPKINAKLAEFARKRPAMYARNVHRIRELGEELAYAQGHNMGIDDLELSNKKHIDKMLDSEENRLYSLGKEKRKEHLINLFNKVQEKVLENDNNLISQAKSKGRGNPATASRVSGSVVYAVDMNSEPYPFLIKNSLAKGLDAHEQYASGGQARFAAVQAAVSTSEPGAMGKVLVANTESLKVVMKDCGTKNGVMMPIDSPAIIGRYEAGTNRLIDEQYVRTLKRQGKKQIKVRSPITCEAKGGVCAMCLGLNSSGSHYDIGHNIGIEAATSVSEKATQLVLSTKHNVGGKKKSDSPEGFKAAKIILNSTDKFPGKAAVATIGGTVNEVKKLPTGGYKIVVGGVEHIASHQVKPKVAVGTSVDKGDILTTGLASTKDILLNRGVLEARKYIADKLDEIHGGSIDKRHFEVISRGYMDLVKPSGQSSNVDLRSFDEYVPTLKGTHEKEMSISDRQITKKFLAEPVLHFSPGRQITNKVVKELRKGGIKKVKVSHTALPYSPVFKTYEQRPMVRAPIWQQINYRGIKKGILKELHYGDGVKDSDIKSDRARLTLGIL